MEVIKSFRLHTLPASVFPVLLAWIVGREALVGNTKFLIYSLLIGIFLQVSTNIFNDLIDFSKGVDGHRTDRGVAANPANRFKMKLVIFVLLLTTFLLGCSFMELHWAYLPIGIVSIYLTYGYTGGPIPLAYNYMGEIFSFIFFGLVIVLGSFYAIFGEITTSAIHLSLSCGLHSVFLIMCNNLRDINTDKENGKNTLAVLMGQNFYLLLMSSNIFLMGVNYYFLTYSWVALIIYSIFHLALLVWLNLYFSDLKTKILFKCSIASYFLFFTLMMVL